MAEDDVARFEEGDDVKLTGYENSLRKPYEAKAYEYEPDEVEYPVDIDEIPPSATYEIISIDWERGHFVYNLRLNGEAEGHDFVRVWGVDEDDLRRV